MYVIHWSRLLLLLFFAQVFHFQGLKISKCKNVCPKMLWRALRKCERVGQAHCTETLNCHGNTLVQECSFLQIGCAKRGSSVNFCYEAVSLVWQGTKSLYRHQKMWVVESVLYLLLWLLQYCIVQKFKPARVRSAGVRRWGTWLVEEREEMRFETAFKGAKWWW